MNERIQKLAYQAEEEADRLVDEGSEFHPDFCRIFAGLIMEHCIENLEFHGHDESVNQLKWLKANRLGLK